MLIGQQLTPLYLVVYCSGIYFSTRNKILLDDHVLLSSISLTTGITGTKILYGFVVVRIIVQFLEYLIELDQ